MVVVKPPEGGPADGDARRTFGGHALKFADGDSIVGGRSPVDTVALEERPRGSPSAGENSNWPSSTRINVPSGGTSGGEFAANLIHSAGPFDPLGVGLGMDDREGPSTR